MQGALRSGNIIWCFPVILISNSSELRIISYFVKTYGIAMVFTKKEIHINYSLNTKTGPHVLQ